MGNRNVPSFEQGMDPREAIKQILKELTKDEGGFLSLRQGDRDEAPLGLKSGDVRVENNSRAMDLFTALITELEKLSAGDMLIAKLLEEARAASLDGRKAALVVADLRELFN